MEKLRSAMSQHKPLSIKIDSKCRLCPQTTVLKPSGRNRVHWHTDEDKVFALLLPGGVFEGHPDVFALAVSGSDPVPNPPLKLLEYPEKQTISNYVYQNGERCIEEDAQDPPDIVIDW
jgi:hypothetical protein